MKKIFTVLPLVVCCLVAFSQDRDSIFMHDKVIVCNINEITENAVKFTYPKESVINTANKNRIIRIKFSSGREQTFSETTHFKEIDSWEDWPDIQLLTTPNEIEGLFKIGDVSSKVKGGSEFSNMNKLKNKAYRKMKIRTAMMGANAAYITDDRSEGLRYSFWGGNTAETVLYGVAYANSIPNIENFKDIAGQNQFVELVDIVKMPYNRKRPLELSGGGKQIDISNYVVESGFIYVTIENEKCRVSKITEDKIHLVYPDKRRIINYICEF